MTTQADSVDPCRARRGELGKSLDSGEPRQATEEPTRREQPPSIFLMPGTKWNARVARTGERCICDHQAKLVIVESGQEMPACSVLLEARTLLRNAVYPCNGHNSATARRLTDNERAMLGLPEQAEVKRRLGEQRRVRG